MMDSTDDLLDTDLLAAFPELNNEFEEYLENPYLTFGYTFSDDFPMESSVSSEESYILTDPVKNVSHDIPINPKEWLVRDKISNRARPPRLFEFLILLLQKRHYASYASYKNKAEGLFEIYEPEKVANLWQHIKNRQSNQNMTYDKFARAIRWYYKLGIMKKTNSRYTFRFASKTLNHVLVDENNNTYRDYTNGSFEISQK